MVTYRPAATIEEWIAALRLVYHSSVRAGMIPTNRYMLRVTPYHLLPTTDLFIAADRSRVILTMTLVRDGTLGIPAEALYPAEIVGHRREGRIFGEVTCLAAEELGNEAIAHFFRLVRVLVQYARFTEKLDELFVVVHPRHALFYQKFLGFEPLGEVKEYPPAEKRPAILLSLDLATLAERHSQVYQILFGSLLPPEQLWPVRLPPEQRRLLEPFVDKRCVPTLCIGDPAWQREEIATAL